MVVDNLTDIVNFINGGSRAERDALADVMLIIFRLGEQREDAARAAQRVLDIAAANILLNTFRTNNLEESSDTATYPTQREQIQAEERNQVALGTEIRTNIEINPVYNELLNEEIKVSKETIRTTIKGRPIGI